MILRKRDACRVCMLPAEQFAAVEARLVDLHLSPGEVVAQIQKVVPDLSPADIFRHDPHIQMAFRGNAHKRARDAVLDGMQQEHQLYLDALEHMLESKSWAAARSMATVVLKSRELLGRAHGLVSNDRGPSVQILNAPGSGAGAGTPQVESVLAQVRAELARRQPPELPPPPKQSDQPRPWVLPMRDAFDVVEVDGD